MAYLDEHASKIPQQRVPRRGEIRHIIVHTTEQPPDLTGEDVRAEQLAKYLLGAERYGSYHKVTDRDSVVVLVEDSNEAFGAKYGWNETALHVSIAMQADKWDDLTPDQRAEYGLQAAQVVADWCRKHNIPAQRITPSNRQDRGILGHGDVDPGRRHDPGFDETEWAAFIATVRQILEGGNPVTFVECPGRYWKSGPWPLWDIYSDGRIVGIDGAPDTEQLTDYGIVRPDHPVTDAWYDADRNRINLYTAADRGRLSLAVKT